MGANRTEPPIVSPQPAVVCRVLSNRVIAVSAALLTLLAGGLAWLLLNRFGDGTAADNARLDGIRTVGTIVLGAGGAIALLLAARRQQTAEQDLVHKRHVQAHVERSATENQVHQLRVAQAAEIDAAERRITDLYDKAVGKLGSEKAAVRFGGLYALERLAQHAPNQQAVVAKVLCAYLRMPFFPPGDDPGFDDGEESRAEYERRREEQRFRLAVQQVLTSHLRFGDDADNPLETFWAEVEIDFSGAALINLNLNGCTLPRGATFQGATFSGNAAFVETTFRGKVEFDYAMFLGDVLFDSTIFEDDATFGSTTFMRFSLFRGSVFAGVGGFDRSTFSEDVSFFDANFAGGAYFLGTLFKGGARFDGATFGTEAQFVDVVFADGSDLSETVIFSEGVSRLDLSRSIVRLDTQNDVFDRRKWPVGWSVLPLESEKLEEGLEGSWGILVRQTDAPIVSTLDHVPS